MDWIVPSIYNVRSRTGHGMSEGAVARRSDVAPVCSCGGRQGITSSRVSNGGCEAVGRFGDPRKTFDWQARWSETTRAAGAHFAEVLSPRAGGER